MKECLHLFYIKNIILRYIDLVKQSTKTTQRGHIFNIKFKLPIVNDGIEYKDDKNKSDGYSLIDGKKSVKTKEQQVYIGNVSKKN